MTAEEIIINFVGFIGAVVGGGLAIWFILHKPNKESEEELK